MIGRTARRTARLRARAPLGPVDGLEPVHLRVDAPLLDRVECVERATAMSVLLCRFPPLADAAATPLPARFERGEILRADGSAWRAEDPVGAGQELWFQRERRPEAVPAADLRILHRDEHLLVVDKPHDMASTPRGAHVLASALVRLRTGTGLEQLSPLHRLDRRTAGVLVLGVRAEERGAYQRLFSDGAVDKEYRALVADHGGMARGDRERIELRLESRHGDLQTRVVPGPPNSVTDLEVGEAIEGGAVGGGAAGGGAREMILRPRTGRTHQLRVHLAHRGTPILGDDLYPSVRPEAECGGQLRLLARSVAFTDPLTGEHRRFVSERVLEAWGAATEGSA